MKASYDAHTDTLSILDYDEQGNLVSLEILDASRRITDARKIDFETTE